MKVGGQPRTNCYKKFSELFSTDNVLYDVLNVLRNPIGAKHRKCNGVNHKNPLIQWHCVHRVESTHFRFVQM